MIRTSESMVMMDKYPKVHSLLHAPGRDKGIRVDMLRLDLIHPFISGNKWYKLRYTVAEVLQQGSKGIVSFGGAYSNHLHALAYAGKQMGIATVGWVRGEVFDNPTLNDCRRWGMKLYPLSRERYRNIRDEYSYSSLQLAWPGWTIVPEGGCNSHGIRGCTEILQGVDLIQYDTIAVPVGTATTFVGLAQSILPEQQLYGFAAMRQGAYLRAWIKGRIPTNNWHLFDTYAGKGFGKVTMELLAFIEMFEENEGILLDAVYTAKMMVGIYDLIENGYINEPNRILAIHTGGTQGNRSLI